MTDKSPTPDLLPRFQTARKLDKAEHGTIGHDMAPIIKGATDIKRSPLGRTHDMDKVNHKLGDHAEAGLDDSGAGALGVAARSMTGRKPPNYDGGNGARAPKLDWTGVRTAAKLEPRSRNEKPRKAGRVS